MDKIKIRDSVGKWPFPLVTELRHAGSRDWVEIDQAGSDDMLGAVPPIYFKGGFFMGEAAAHVEIDGRVVPVYAGVAEVAGRFFVREFPRTTSECIGAMADLRLAVDPALASVK